jgi:hypothetical protein
MASSLPKLTQYLAVGSLDRDLATRVYSLCIILRFESGRFFSRFFHF